MTTSVYLVIRVSDSNYNNRTMVLQTVLRHERSSHVFMPRNVHEEPQDANMVELRETGFMSNRGRQNVASFFTKDMNMDWRIGFASCSFFFLESAYLVIQVSD